MSKGTSDDWAPLASVGKTVEFAFAFQCVVAQEAGADALSGRSARTSRRAARRTSRSCVNIPASPWKSRSCVWSGRNVICPYLANAAAWYESLSTVSCYARTL